MGNICIIKQLAYPKLIYSLSVLSVTIPAKFVNEINRLFFILLYGIPHGKRPLNQFVSKHFRWGVKHVGS